MKKEIDLIFSDLKNEVITEKQAHYQVLNLINNYKLRKEIDEKIFCFHIFPCFDKVYAEIYYINDNNLQIQVLSKEFGSIWRKPIEKDYIEANKWCKNQLNWIEYANI